MSPAITVTESTTFTVTHARHMAAKVATDLKRMQRFYGNPSDSDIANYEVEAIELLKADISERSPTASGETASGSSRRCVTRRATSQAWLRTTTTRAGFARARDIEGATFYSYMTYSAAWNALSASRRMPSRAGCRSIGRQAPEPAVNGYLADDRTYSAGGRRTEPRKRKELLMETKPSLDELFERRMTYPDFERAGAACATGRPRRPQGRLTKMLGLLVNPAGLETWAQKHHPGADGAAEAVLRRPPLVVLAGDVGSGKTELAETIGDAVARQEKIEITPSR